VCVFAINVGAGTSNSLLDCRIVAALGNNPTGNLEAAVGGSGTLAVSGWTLDPDVAGSGQVHTYVDGRYRGSTPAATARPDVRSVFPAGARAAVSAPR
jgi:hypothetical protein